MNIGQQKHLQNYISICFILPKIQFIGNLNKIGSAEKVCGASDTKLCGEVVLESCC